MCAACAVICVNCVSRSLRVAMSAYHPVCIWLCIFTLRQMTAHSDLSMCVCVHVCALGLHVCVSAVCLSVITKVFAHALFVFKVSRPMQFIGFFTTSHGPSRSFLLFLPLHRLLVVFREKLQLRFRRKCDLQGREERRVVSNILEKDLSFDW